eukprot:Clim_evm8s253 gene=Clim_evmTU8s253
MATVSAHPVHTYVDEELEVVVTGLEQGSTVLVSVELAGNRPRQRFFGGGVYKASPNGQVRTSVYESDQSYGIPPTLQTCQRHQDIWKAAHEQNKDVERVPVMPCDCNDYYPFETATYGGSEAMGLFWSITACEHGGRFFKARPMEHDKLFIYVFLLDSPTVNITQYAPIAHTVAYRYYVAPGTRRVEVSDGTLRGCLYVPPCAKPALQYGAPCDLGELQSSRSSLCSHGQRYPAMLDMQGSTGGLIEHRAAMLSRYGFMVFALGYFGYKDRPKILEEVDTVHFDEAVRYLYNHELTLDRMVGIVGLSRGAQNGMQATIRNPDLVKAFVCISGTHLRVCPAFMTNGVVERCADIHYELLDPSVKYLSTLKAMSPFVDRYHPDPPWLTEVHWRAETAKAHYLFIAGGDDQHWNSTQMHQNVVDRLQENNYPYDFQSVSYPGAGHIIDPAYYPSCSCSFNFHKLMQCYGVWGGSLRPNAHAYVHSWHLMIDFLEKHLKAPRHPNLVVRSMRSAVITTPKDIPTTRVLSGTLRPDSKHHSRM